MFIVEVENHLARGKPLDSIVPRLICKCNNVVSDAFFLSIWQQQRKDVGVGFLTRRSFPRLDYLLKLVMALML